MQMDVFSLRVVGRVAESPCSAIFVGARSWVLTRRRHRGPLIGDHSLRDCVLRGRKMGRGQEHVHGERLGGYLGAGDLGMRCLLAAGST